MSVTIFCFFPGFCFRLKDFFKKEIDQKTREELDFYSNVKCRVDLEHMLLLCLSMRLAWSAVPSSYDSHVGSL